MTSVVYSVRFNPDNPDEARIIEVIERAQAEHGRAGVRKIMVAAFMAMLQQRDETSRMLDRQDEILRVLDRLQRAGIAVTGEEIQPSGVGGLDPEFTANLASGFTPGRKRK